MSELTTVLASITIIVFMILAILMLYTIIHLIDKICKKWKKKHVHGNRTFIYYLITTVFGISCFELAVLIIITIAIETFLLDDMIQSRIITSQFYFKTYPVFQHLIVTFDSLGHLSMSLIFIGRFQFVFNAEIFNQSKYLIRSLYTMWIILALCAIGIIFPIPCIHSDVLELRTIWEICSESLVVFILFLFISNLYKLLKLSLWSHLKNSQNPHDVLSEITKISLESSKSFRNKNTLTIDGNVVDPIEAVSMNKSTNVSMNKSSGYQTDEAIDTDHDETNAKAAKSGMDTGYSQTLEILAVMSKMTLLVCIVAISSFWVIIAHFAIDGDHTHEGSHHHDPLWVYILPAVHMVIIAFMLYLQFNFTHNLYRSMCHCLDSIFLRCMLGMIAHCWKIKTDPELHEDDGKEIKTLSTKSTVSTAPSNPISMTATCDDIQIEMQAVVR